MPEKLVEALDITTQLAMAAGLDALREAGIPLVQTYRLEQFPSVAFDDRCADDYGRVRSMLKKQGQMIGANDLLIAAIALANNLTLVTANTSEFGRIPGLRLENWEV